MVADLRNNSGCFDMKPVSVLLMELRTTSGPKITDFAFLCWKRRGATRQPGRCRDVIAFPAPDKGIKANPGKNGTGCRARARAQARGKLLGAGSCLGEGKTKKSSAGSVPRNNTGVVGVDAAGRGTSVGH